MYKNLIVIATNNGKNFLIDLLKSINNLNDDFKICVIDTGSEDVETIEYLNNLNNIILLKTPDKNYDTGAYIWAFKNVEAEYYHCIHDSLIIKDINLFNKINEMLNTTDVVSLISFQPNILDSPHDIKFIKENFNPSEYKLGIFGPMFSLRKETIDKISITDIILPKNKDEQMAMERGWSCIFNKYDMEIKPICGMYDYYSLIRNEYDYIIKKIPYRK